MCGRWFALRCGRAETIAGCAIQAASQFSAGRAESRAHAAALAAMAALMAVCAGPWSSDLAMLPNWARFMAIAAPRFSAEVMRQGAPWPDIQVAAYAGPSYTMPSDVRLRQPGGTDLTLYQVPWRGEPFVPPPYYG